MSELATTLFPQRSNAALPHTAQQENGLSRFGFFLFMLINATLFVRPSELFESLNGWPIYEALCELCILVSLPKVIREFSPRTLKRWPISACVVGLLFAVALSQLSHLHFGDALDGSIDFLKLVMYFVLLMVHINSLSRLKQFLLGLALLTIGMTVLSLLQYHNYINMPQLAAYYERQDDTIDEDTGEAVTLGRLCSLGIFNNPNDLARILIVAIFICLSFMGDTRRGASRFAWIIPIGMLGYATALTYSRGGFLGLLGGMLVLCYVRYGRAKTVLSAAVVLPLLFVIYSGRQTNIDIEDGTGHQRILLWRDGLAEMMRMPLFGTGIYTYEEIAGLVAHNSFVHAFVELGLFGGILFFGLFFFGTITIYQSKRYDAYLADSDLPRLRPYIIALLTSYGIGMLSSSRCYEVPTYTLVGIAAVYYRLLGQKLGEVQPSFNGATIRRLVAMGLMVLAGLIVFVRINA